MIRRAALVATLLAGPAMAADPPLASYKSCIVAAAARLSTGPDAADLIAKHAPAFCGSERRALEAALGSISDPIARFRTIEAAEQQAIDTATTRILDLRAK
ncbi:MAG: hypothetical protein JWQ01_4915 [Massilia sp.]|nr:hypothetical protein [Massilia sp.]